MGFSITKEKDVKRIFVIVYIVGALGMSIPQTFTFFTKFIPYMLLLNFFYLAYFHPDKKGLKQLLVFLFIFLISIIIEIFGVNTGKIFGEYHYGSRFGLKIFETPVLIGFNWLFLTYTSSSVLEKLHIPVLFKIIGGSAIMLTYDLLIEQVAPILDIWSWKNEGVPAQNYVVWFGMAMLFHVCIKVFKVKTANPLSGVILISQFIFFVILLIFLR